MKVEMLVNTYYKRPLKPGDVVDVSAAVAERWERNGIAKLIATVSEVPPAEDQPKSKRGAKKNDAN